jgi:hypothetical protein
LRRLEDEESEDEGGEDEGEDREAIANQLFEGSDNVSKFHLLFSLFIHLSSLDVYYLLQFFLFQAGTRGKGMFIFILSSIHCFNLLKLNPVK